MSMIGNFLQLTPAELDALIADPSQVESFIYPGGEESDAGIDVDKAWQGLHFLLTGDPWGGAGPLAQVVLGGVEIGEDVGYGPARYITADEVRAAAAALGDLSSESFASRYDRAALQANNIYPDIWDEDGLEYLAAFFDELRDYFMDAAEKGNAMLKYLN